MLDSPELASLLSDADLAHVAVDTGRGPLVTPLLHTVHDGRVWLVMPRSSAKASALGRDGRLGVTLGTAGAGAAVLQGEAKLVDLLRPQSLVGAVSEALASPAALGSYVLDNLPHLADMIGPAALSPRLAAALTPARAVAVHPDRPLWSAGDWAPGAELAEDADEDGDTEGDLDLREVPEDIRAVAERPGPVLVGWRTAGGPVALPAAWDPQRGRATVRADLFATVGAPSSSPACVLFDATAGTDLDDKAGLVLRGRGSAAPSTDAGGAVDVRVEADRGSWWQGAASHPLRVD